MPLHDQEWIQKQEQDEQHALARIEQLQLHIANSYLGLSVNRINCLDLESAQEYLTKARNSPVAQNKLQSTLWLYLSAQRALSAGTLSADDDFPTISRAQAEQEILDTAKAAGCQANPKAPANLDTWGHIECLFEDKHAILKAAFSYTTNQHDCQSPDHLLRYQLRIVDGHFSPKFEQRFITFAEALQAFKTFLTQTDEEAEQKHFIRGLVERGDAVVPDADGNVPLSATHRIIGYEPDGTPVIERVKFL